MSGPRTLSRYPDDEANDRDFEQNVVNVSPHEARFEIGAGPGAQPRRYRLKPGQSVTIQSGYTKPFTGAGRQPVRATIESLTERQVYPGGPSLPMVVHADRAAEVRAQWSAMIAKGAAPPPPVKVMVPRADGGEPIEMTVQPAAAPILEEPVPMRRAAPVVEDDEDQTGEPIDEPPPDHNDPEPPTVGGAK